MPLSKATKTVLFSDGMGDDSDRFLLESPAVDYAENLRVDKAGSLQKRPGFGPDALASVPDASGAPIAMHAMGNDLHVIVDEGVRTWNGSEWRESNAESFLGGSEVELESQNFLGLSNCSYQPTLDTGGDIIGHVIAYEVRETASVSGAPDWNSGNKHVIIQRYDENGRFIDQRKINEARSPQVLATRYTDNFGTPQPTNTVFYQSDADGGVLRFLNISQPPFLLTAPGPRTTVYVPENEPKMKQYAATDRGVRLGQGVIGQSRYFVKYMESADRFVVFFTSLTGVYIRSVVPDSGVGDEGHSPATQNADVLALDVDGPYAFVVYQYYDISSGDWRVLTARYNANMDGGPLEAPMAIMVGTEVEFAPTFTHCGLGLRWVGSPTDHRGFVALHYSGYQSASEDVDPGSPTSQGKADYWWPWNVRASDVGIRTFEVDWIRSSVVAKTDLQAHRITTNPYWFNGQWHMGVQQWLDYTPQHLNPGGCNEYVNVDPATKPVTTAICVWNNSNGRVTPVASLDAGQSGHVDYGESECAIHLGTLVEHDGVLLASNRVKIRAEDNSFYIGAADSDWRRTSNVEVGSDSLCRVHRITPGGLDVHSAEFGDGLALSTAVPLWFDSGGLGEFGPLDSPEIIRVEDADFADVDPLGTHSQWMQLAPTQGYDEMTSAENVEWRKFSCLWGFVDSRGNTHRSAPSATLYVSDLEEDRNSNNDGATYSGREVSIWVTTPLSLLPDGREYFLEIYVSTGVDTDMQLAAQSSISVDDAATPVKTTFQLNRAVEDDANVTKTILRSTEPVYTTGGVLAADPWPSFSKSVVQSTRFWALDATNKGRVIYSKLFEDFIAPEYNPTLSINLGDERDLTAIGKLDDKVVVFESDDIHVIYGDGPDNRGQGQDFAVHYISTDVGCTDQESIIETPIGLIFYSEPRGFYLLDRNLQVQFIGGGIEDTARGIDIVSATLVRDKAEVRFAFTGGASASEHLGPGFDTDLVDRPPRPVFTNWAGHTWLYPALTFNYERGTWMTYSNYNAVAATIYQGKYTMLRSDWDIWQEKEDRWDDPTGLNTTMFTTPWIKLSENIQDFNRLWSMTIVGRYLSSLQDLGWVDDGGPYVYEDNVGTGGGFGQGDVRFNAVDLLDATVCRVVDVNADGVDQTSFLDKLTDTTVTVLTDIFQGCVFQCSGTTAVGGYHELDIVAGSLEIRGNGLTDLDDVVIGAQKYEFEAGDILVRVYYDYESSYLQAKTWTIQDFGYDPFNNPPKRAERFQFELAPKRGRCQAVKLEFVEQPSQDVAAGITYKQGRGFEIVAVDFHVGVGPSRTLIPQRSKK